MCLLGTFSPYTVVHHTSVVKIDKDIPLQLACLVGCCVTTGYGSAVYTAGIGSGDDVGIVGVGGVGVAALQGAINAGARTVVAIDPVEWKREQAIKFGATHTFASIDEAFGAVAEATSGRMLDKVLITVGHMTGDLVDPALMLTAKAGRCVVTAMGSMLDSDVKLSLFVFTMMQKELRGTIFGGGNARIDIPKLLSLYRMGKLNLDDMVSRRYRLDQINDAYQDMLDGNIIRGIIRYTDEDRG